MGNSINKERVNKLENYEWISTFSNKTSTILGSNWLPEYFFSSFIASSLLKFFFEIIDAYASETAIIRPSIDISSPFNP